MNSSKSLKWQNETCGEIGAKLKGSHLHTHTYEQFCQKFNV